MRVAVLADIHGNLIALEAVLKRVREIGVDLTMVAGDVVVGSPDSRSCWELVKSLRCPVLRGNHERYVFDLGTPRAKPEWSTLQFGPVQYAAVQLGREAVAELACLPATLKIPGADGVLFVHASARNDSDLVFPYTSDEELAPMFAGVSEEWIIRAHNHYAGVRLRGGQKIVTAGAVGLPLDGTPRAQFLWMESHAGSWTLRHEAVAYDVVAATKRFEQSGYLREAGPMARLFCREVATASFQIVPFLQFQRRLNAEGLACSLDEAVDRFLSASGDRLT